MNSALLHTFPVTSGSMHRVMLNSSSRRDQQQHQMVTAVMESLAQQQEAPLPALHAMNIVLGVLLSCVLVLTILGNALVIIVVVRERILKTVTNYFLVSLASADLLMGGLVMPFAAANEFSAGHWQFGVLWCLLWQAVDVLSSTASILNLTMIAIDRWWAIHPTFNKNRVTCVRCGLMIGLVWILSSLISFPAILWWQANKVTQPHVSSPGEKKQQGGEGGTAVSAAAAVTLNPHEECVFTEDSVYLLCSSVISFYSPLAVMVCVYVRIFLTARRMIASLNAGHKLIYNKDSPANPVVLRMHRGGQQTHASPATAVGHHNNNLGNTTTQQPPCSPRSLLGADEQQQLLLLSDTHRPLPTSSSLDSAAASRRHNVLRRSLFFFSSHSPANAANLHLSRRSLAVGRRVSKFAREQRAAKTLGVVMGIFIVCWTPFFLCNTLKAMKSDVLGDSEQSKLILAIVTYLGYINSAVNPLIYAHSMRDFRRAFLRVLCTRAYLQRHSNIGQFTSGRPLHNVYRHHPPANNNGNTLLPPVAAQSTFVFNPHPYPQFTVAERPRTQRW